MVWALIIAPTPLGLLSGCSSGTVPPRNGDNGNANDNGGSSNPDAALTLDTLAASWAIQRETDDKTIWGIALAAAPSNESVALTVLLDETFAPGTLELSINGDEVEGYWSDLDAERTEKPNWQAQYDPSTRLLEGLLTLNGQTHTLRLHRGMKATGAATAVWNRIGDDAGAIIATDVNAVAISVLDDDTNWPVEGHYDGAYTEPVEGFEFLADVFNFLGFEGGGEGIFFDRGQQLLILERAVPVDGVLVNRATRFEKTDEAGELTGLWIGNDREPDDNQLARRQVRRVVEYEGRVYIHQGGDTYAQSLERWQILDSSDTGYEDNSEGFEWSGRFNLDRTRLVGEWVGYDGWYQSMDRTATPGPADLSGSFGSVDINYTFSYVPPSTGSSELSFDGQTLTIRDTREDGVDFALEAEWTGDQFVGEWWAMDTPSERYPWRGHWIPEYNYLHGQWSEGEWSFCQAAIRRADDPAVAERVIFQDPNSARAAMLRDEASGSLYTLYKNQERLTHMVAIVEGGQLRVDFDERMRPTRMAGPGELLELEWQDTGTSVTIIHTNTETQLVQTASLELDLSDEAILGYIAAAEVRDNADYQDHRDFIADFPGAVEAIATTGIVPPEYRQGTQTGKYIDSIRQQAVPGRGLGVGPGFQVVVGNDTGVFDTMLIAGAIHFALGGAVLAAGLTFPAALLAVAGGAIIGTALILALGFDLLFFLLFGSDTCCSPCGLGCFFSCCDFSPDQIREVEPPDGSYSIKA